MNSRIRLLALMTAVTLVIAGCSSDEAIDPIEAQAQFCSDVESYVEAIGEYGGLLQDVELNVGDVKSAHDDLAPGLEAVEESAAEFRTAVETDPTSGLTIDLVAPETIQAVEDAEAAFAEASDIDDGTPVVEAGARFSSAAYGLEVAWVRLFLDAGCLDGDERAQAQAQQWVSDYVSAFQTDLQTIGYYNGAIDGIYGPDTIAAVESFQEDNGLEVTGLVDPPTQVALGLALAGKASAQVGALQAIMIATGHYSGPVDGIWSPAVESALIDLQNDLGVPATGVIDSATLQALEEALAAAGVEPEIPSTTVPGAPATTAPPAATTTTAPEATTTTIAVTTTTAPDSAGILEVLEEAGQFEQFLAAVEAAGLTDMLSGPGPYTIFAPTDDAFDAAGDLPTDPEALSQLILYHVVEGDLTAFDIAAEDTLVTLQGAEISVTLENGLLTLNDASTITIANVVASNGVAHIVNAVLVIPG
ncbi:MAG TPA: peptidoglycan-binding protein [Acidimicrobiia bacterium]